MKLTAMDIGSNSIKLAVADAVDSDSFAVDRAKDVIRPGHETLRKGRLRMPWTAVTTAASTI